MVRGLTRSALRARVRDAAPSSLLNLVRLVLGIVSLSRADKYECNLCGHSGRFWPSGDPPVRGTICGKCNSRQRHRLVGLWIETNPMDVDGARILHFAPEPILSRLLRNRSAEYRSADLDPAIGDTVLNIENIDLPDDSVDLVMCSHVLEHVDDARALREIHRILTPGGRAFLMFPVIEGWEHTYENPAHTSPADRAKYFGQSDHVRMFGRDVRDRIASAGFALTEFTAEEPNVSRYGLTRGEKLFIATKPM
jgi:SAM-dependent methyltransferase